MSTAQQIAPIESPTGGALSLLRPIATPSELLSYHEVMTSFIAKALRAGVDYGKIPGTDKATLLKPGAERLCLAFGAVPTFELVEKELDHMIEVPWQKKKKRWLNRHHGDRAFEEVVENGTSLGLYRYVYRCRIMRGGILLAESIGVCSTLESKYVDRPRDCENAASKMAQKRAFTGATVLAFGLSDRFNGGDAREPGEDDEEEPAANARGAKPAAKTSAPQPPPRDVPPVGGAKP